MSGEMLYDLLKKYREGACTPEEQKKLDAWYEEFDGDAGRISAVPEEKLKERLTIIYNLKTLRL